MILDLEGNVLLNPSGEWTEFRSLFDTACDGND